MRGLDNKSQTKGMRRLLFVRSLFDTTVVYSLSKHRNLHAYKLHARIWPGPCQKSTRITKSKILAV